MLALSTQACVSPKSLTQEVFIQLRAFEESKVDPQLIQFLERAVFAEGPQRDDSRNRLIAYRNQHYPRNTVFPALYAIERAEYNEEIEPLSFPFPAHIMFFAIVDPGHWEPTPALGNVVIDNDIKDQQLLGWIEATLVHSSNPKMAERLSDIGGYAMLDKRNPHGSRLAFLAVLNDVVSERISPKFSSLDGISDLTLSEEMRGLKMSRYDYGLQVLFVSKDESSYRNILEDNQDATLQTYLGAMLLSKLYAPSMADRMESHLLDQIISQSSTSPTNNNAQYLAGLLSRHQLVSSSSLERLQKAHLVSGYGKVSR